MEQTKIGAKPEQEKMARNNMLNVLDRLIMTVKTGILATLEKDGKPRMRWMIPVVLKEKPAKIYAISCPNFHWVKALIKSASHKQMLRNRTLDLMPPIEEIQIASDYMDAEWMFFTPAWNEILEAKGKIKVLDDSHIKNHILKSIGPKLSAFWKVNLASMEIVALETMIEEIYYFAPGKGGRIDVKFPACT